MIWQLASSSAAEGIFVAAGPPAITASRSHPCRAHPSKDAAKRDRHPGGLKKNALWAATMHLTGDGLAYVSNRMSLVP